eukprot:5115949-Pleurochrysis_carterae.AAC.1
MHRRACAHVRSRTCAHCTCTIPHAHAQGQARVHCSRARSCGLCGQCVPRACRVRAACVPRACRVRAACERASVCVGVRVCERARAGGRVVRGRARASARAALPQLHLNDWILRKWMRARRRNLALVLRSPHGRYGVHVAGGQKWPRGRRPGVATWQVARSGHVA